MKRRILKLGLLLFAVLCLLLTVCGIKMASDPTGSTESTEPIHSETIPQNTEEPTITEPSETEEVERMPWEEAGAKQPMDYSKEEYNALSAKQRKAFQQYLGADGFAAWLEETEAEVNPWELPDAKQPEDYTVEEYEALTKEQKTAFMEYLGPLGMENWLNKDQNQSQNQNQNQNQPPNQGTEYPWSKPGAKQPQNYTLAEYHALTYTQQVAFVNHLGSDGFQKWMAKVQGQKTQYPWEKPGAKQPREYTWEEYTALTEAQKKAFQGFLGKRGFEAWQEWAQREENPWEESGAKQPDEYSWEEYEQLTETQKLAFQEHLGADAFESWMQDALHQGGKTPWEKPDAKQPKDYSWEEYKALSETLQVAFQNHLGSSGLKTWIKSVTGIPWDKVGAKQPADYTLQEYNALSEAQKLAFWNELGSDKFEDWLFEAQNPKETNPWEKPGAKQPADYTWKEYEGLNEAQQMAFQEYLGKEGFETWRKKNQSQDQPKANPWEKPGAKQPADYTWKEFEALTEPQQMAFQEYLGEEGFEAWLDKNQSKDQPVDNPWEKPGAKQPADYTWKEFEALNKAQQMAFQDYLGTEGFDAWLRKNQNQSKPMEKPWEKPGAKQPSDYTWEEYNALSGELQMAFQAHLGNEGFDNWLIKNQGQNQPAENPWEKPGAKQPADYSWEDFNNLTGAQQMAFQNYLGASGFDDWLNRNQSQSADNPWEKPGAKQPADYSWEDFNSLTGAQQMAFQQFLGPDAFEAWLNQTHGNK